MATTTLGSGTHIAQFDLTEDFYNGHAQYQVVVNGERLGFPQTIYSDRDTDQHDTLNVLLGEGNYYVSLRFLNDDWGGSADTDRNMYINSVKIDGADLRQSAGLFSNDEFFSTNISTLSMHTASFTLSQDTYGEASQFIFLVDGQQSGAVNTVTVDHDTGRGQSFSVSLSAGAHDVSIVFLNDAWGGTPETDRNLYVDSVAYDGVRQVGSASLFSTGDHFDYTFA